MSDLGPRIEVVGPRIEVVDPGAGRLEPDLPASAADASPPAAWGTPALALAGVGVLALGLPALATANFVAAQFARGAALGWATLGVAAAGFGLIAAAGARELRGLLRLHAVDRLREALAGSDAARKAAAAREWAAVGPGGAALLPALDAVNDPDAAVALLRAGPGAELRARSEALGRTAAVQVAAGVAVVPAPAFAVLLLGWRGLRLVREVAALHGVRPGLAATMGLLRRTALAATLVGATEVAVNAAAHAALSNPLLGHALGEMAGAGVAARRMLLLARAAAQACSPLPPE